MVSYVRSPSSSSSSSSTFVKAGASSCAMEARERKKALLLKPGVLIRVSSLVHHAAPLFTALRHRFYSPSDSAECRGQFSLQTLHPCTRQHPNGFRKRAAETPDRWL
eukprot:2791569-Rhodomonas_salina.3